MQTLGEFEVTYVIPLPLVRMFAVKPFPRTPEDGRLMITGVVGMAFPIVMVVAEDETEL
jgi:hypothetical protein